MIDVTQSNPKIAILAGWGRYPIVLARSLQDVGYSVHCLAIHGHADESLSHICDGFKPVSPTRIGAQIRYLRKHGITKATMAGKIFKTRLFHRNIWIRHIPDMTFIKYFHKHFFTKTRDNKDDTLLLSAVNMFADFGIEFAPATDFAPELLVKKGTLTKRCLTTAQKRDLTFAWNLAREMGRLDVGQSVAVKNQAVLAVEAVEGTDECIRRAGKLCSSGGFTVVKVAKPQQDMRFDVPTIGVGTIQTMHEAGGKVLVVEAGKTIILDEDELIELANQLGICIISTTDAAMNHLAAA